MPPFAQLSLPDDPNSPPPHTDKLPISMQLINLAAVALPPVALVVGMVLLWGWGFSWIHLLVMTAMYVLTGFGITIGYHRYFTHKSFEVPRWMHLSLAVLGSMAAEGPVLRWVANHRQHHQHSDKHDDPHSPHLHGGGFTAMCKGMWHAHVGWMFEPDQPDGHRYVPDLIADPALVRISKSFALWVAIGIILPGVLTGLLTMSWTGALLGVIWGGLVRIMLVHHLTWSINSVCHIWGTQPFRTHDQSRNNPIFGVFSLGEGWHNNHHAFPTSARHGLRWWEIDFSYWIIRLMEIFGIARKVRVPSRETMEAKRNRPARFELATPSVSEANV